MDSPRETLVVFARAPRLGEVKTRLAARLGPDRALSIYRELAEGVVGAARGAADRVALWYTPPNAAAELRDWLGDALAYEPQGEGDIGARMAGAIDRELHLGATRVVVIGTDCPTLDASTIREAFGALDAHDVVFGPAADGGYYLVGVRSAQRALFDGIPWSHPETLAVSLRRAADAGLRVALLHEMRDVDTCEDWEWHRQRA